MKSSRRTPVTITYCLLYATLWHVSEPCKQTRPDGTCLCSGGPSGLMMSDKTADGRMGLVLLTLDNSMVEVCLSTMEPTMADIVCRQFGFQQHVGFGARSPDPVNLSVQKFTTFGQCKGYEECLAECEGHFWQPAVRQDAEGNIGSCYQHNERSIICSNERKTDIPTRPTLPTFDHDDLMEVPPSLPLEPADAPMGDPTTWIEKDGPTDQPFFPVVDFDSLPPADAPMPQTPITWLVTETLQVQTGNTSESQFLMTSLETNQSYHLEQMMTAETPTMVTGAVSVTSNTAGHSESRTRQANITMFTTQTGQAELCDQALQLNVDGGQLTSPGYPDNYPNDITCSWLISVSQHQKVIFNIVVFQTAEPDGIRIYADSREGDLIQDLSGHITGSPGARRRRSVLTVDTGVRSVYVEFTSDSSTSDTGFYITYTAEHIQAGEVSEPKTKNDESHSRNIVIIIVVIILLVLLAILLVCCKVKCGKNSNQKRMLIYDGFGSKSKIVPQDLTESKDSSSSWAEPRELDSGFHISDSEEKPPPPVEIQASTLSTFTTEKSTGDVWRTSESAQSGWVEDCHQQPPSAGVDTGREQRQEKTAGHEEELVVRDTILMMGEGHRTPRPKQPGPKTEGPLDTSLPKKTPPGQEESQIGGSSLSHLYKPAAHRTSISTSQQQGEMVTVPYAASMYTSRGQAIHMLAARGYSSDSITTNSVKASSVNHTSSVLAQKRVPPPHRRDVLSPSVSALPATDDQKISAGSASYGGQVRGNMSRPSSASSSRVSGAGSELSMTRSIAGSENSITGNNGASECSNTKNSVGSEFSMTRNRAGSEHSITRNSVGSEHSMTDPRVGSESSNTDNNAASECISTKNNAGSEHSNTGDEVRSECSNSRNRTGSERIATGNSAGSELDPPQSSRLPSRLMADPPEDFVCPLTKEVMRQPVVFEDGHVYEKKAILSWCQSYSVSPVTKQTIHTGKIQPNPQLKQRIKEWRKTHMQALLSMVKGPVTDQKTEA